MATVCALQREKPPQWEAQSLHSERDPGQPKTDGWWKEKKAVPFSLRQLQADPGLPSHVLGFGGPTAKTAKSAHAHRQWRSQNRVGKTLWLSDCKPVTSGREECPTRNVTLLPRKAQPAMWKASRYILTCPGLYNSVLRVMFASKSRRGNLLFHFQRHDNMCRHVIVKPADMPSKVKRTLSPTLLVGMQISTATTDKSWEGPWKPKSRTIIRLGIYWTKPSFKEIQASPCSRQRCL